MSGRWRIALAATALVIGALTLAPVWLSPVLATNDGPSHVYNAALAGGVERGEAPFATYFRLQQGLRPNLTSEMMLRTLGPLVGWETAERLLVTLIMVATFLAVLAFMRNLSPLSRVLLVPLAGWLASNWFVWGGAYDFALSIPVFCALLYLVRRPLTTRVTLLVQLVMILLYLTHIFTFAVGIGVIVGVVGWRAVAASPPRWAELRDLWVALPSVALLVIELGSGGPGSGALLWGDRWQTLRGLLMGDVIVSASHLDLAGGVLVMAGACAVAVVRWRDARRSGRAVIAGEEVVGLALLALSLVAPEGVGPGTYIPIRMRMLGIMALVPAIGWVASRRRTPLVAAGGLLAAGLVTHTTALMRDARVWDYNVQLIDHLLTAAGAHEGSWVATRFESYYRGLYHVVGYRHVMERVALRRRLVVLDNYEALYGVFPTVWRGIPDWLDFRPSEHALTVRLVPGEIPWSEHSLFVLHESSRVLQLVDPRLTAGLRASGGPFSVTHVWRRE